MTRRTGRRTHTSPILGTGASAAWRASDAVDNGSVTTSLVPYIGTGTLTRSGTGQAIRSASALLGGAPAISFNGSSVNGCYQAVTLGAAPTAFSFVSVTRVSATECGMSALTNAGTLNTGCSSLHSGGNTIGRCVGIADASSALAAPVNIVHLVTISPAGGMKSYVNSATPVSVASANTLAGTTWHIGGLSGTGTYTLNGLWAETAYWLRTLSALEARAIIKGFGLMYGITVSL